MRHRINLQLSLQAEQGVGDHSLFLAGDLQCLSCCVHRGDSCAGCDAGQLLLIPKPASPDLGWDRVCSLSECQMSWKFLSESSGS